MRLVSIDVQNFKPFRNLRIPQDDEELPRGLILVRGANSTGKSSLFEAILWALWGPTAVGLTNDELVNFSSSFTRVELVFEVAGTRYLIKRTYDSANKMAVILSQRKDDVWKRIADKSQTVNRKVEGILNLELNQALQTLLVRQGEVALIASATPNVLRELLEKVYNIELLDQMKKQLENLEASSATEIRVLNEEYRPPEMIREQMTEAESRIKLEEKELESVTEEKAKSEKLLKQLPSPKGLKAIHELFMKLERTEDELNRSMDEMKSELKEAGLVDPNPQITKARLTSLRKENRRLEKERKAALEKSNGINREIGTHEGIILDVEEKADHLTIHVASGERADAPCPTCEKPLTAGEREKLLKKYNKSIKEHRKQVSLLEKERIAKAGEIEETEERLRTIPQAIEAVRRVAKQHKDMVRTTKDIEKMAEMLGTLLKGMDADTVEKLLAKHDVGSLDDLRNKIVKLQTTLSSLQTQYESALRRIEKEKRTIKELEGKEARMKELGAEIKNLEELKEHATYVRRKLVSGFIADYVFQKRLIGIVRKATNQYVSSFTNGQYTSVDLEPTQAKGRSGSGLLLKIWDERDKAKKKSSQLSFGDRTAISLGLRLGISRTMSSIRPFKDSPSIAPRVRCVLLDEPLGGLDRSRRESVVRNLVNDESFEQIFLITHTDVHGWEGVPVVEVSKSGPASIAVLSQSSDT
ncbi:MAG: AAA family ATPase [Candidatus Thorarchaeota archaeon]